MRKLAALLLVVAAACGSGAARAYTDEELGGALLALEDLPTGWALSPADDDEDEEDPSDICGITPEVEETNEVSVEFSKGQLGDRLFQSVLAFASVDEAERSVAEFRDAIGACDEWEQTTDDGSLMTLRPSPLSFATFGDETLAIRVDIEVQGRAEGMEFTAHGSGDVIIVRRASIGTMVSVLAIGLFGPPEVDSTQTEGFVERADGKLAALL